MADHDAVASNAKFLDALDRAWRTFKQGVLVDALSIIGGGTLVLLQSGDVMSPAFWSAVGILTVKTFVMTIASFLHRMKSAPKTLKDIDPAP